jgi:DNA polymerase I-like protein with 3'-5' exonuclease and polymerase domains
MIHHNSSRNPNMMNMPSDPEFRGLFIAEPGNKMVVCDYSQIEVRVGGLLAGEEAIAEAFKAGHDFHTATAARVFGVEYGDVTKDQRKAAKAVTFGMQYGMGNKSLAKALGVSVAEASRYVKQWKSAYPKVAEWRDHSDKTGHKEKQLFTAGGRRIALQDSPSPSVCYNYPVQGSAADIMMAALSILACEIDGKPWKLLAVVHDEVLMEVPESDVAEAKRVLEESMIAGMLEIFPGADTTGLVDASAGDSWAAK